MPGGIGCAKLVIGRQLAGRGKLDDLGVHRLADSRALRPDVPSAIISERSAGRVREHLGGVVVGPAAKRVLALDLQDGPHLVKDLGDACGFHERAPRCCVGPQLQDTWSRTIGQDPTPDPLAGCPEGKPASGSTSSRAHGPDGKSDLRNVPFSALGQVRSSSGACEPRPGPRSHRCRAGPWSWVRAREPRRSRGRSHWHPSRNP